MMTGSSAGVAKIARWARQESGTRARAQTVHASSFAQRVGALVAPVLEAFPTANLVVGIARARSHRVYGFAPRASAGSVPDGATTFEMGGVTNVFTTALLAALVAKRRLRLDDCVRDLLPELERFPPEITLRRLATHTSGLPENPYGACTPDALLAWLAQYAPQPPRDSTVVAYSNVGFALLAHVCARAAGTSYEEAVEAWILRPLGLRDTVVGAGALRSNAADMLLYLGASLRPERTLRALGRCHEVQVAGPALVSGVVLQEMARAFGLDTDEGLASHPRLQPGRFRVALGWLLTLDEDGREILWHNGAAGGCRAFLGLSKHERVAAVVLANYGVALGGAAIDEIGFGVLRLLSVAAPD
jgi:CubicO group peptidase (beta-lactamase class C family)